MVENKFDLSSFVRGQKVFQPVFLGTLLVIAAAYFVTATLGLKFATIHDNVTPIWPPAGIALAAFLLLGNRVWPGVFLGAFLTGFWAEATIGGAVGIAVGNTMEGLAGAALMRWFVGDEVRLGTIREVLVLVLGGLLASTIAATLGVTSLAISGLAPWDGFVGIWRVWWLGDATGIIVFTPFIIAWLGTSRRTGNILSFEGVVVLAAAFLLAYLIFGGVGPGHSATFAPFSLLVWASLRLGHRGATTATILIACIATVGTALGLGPFGKMPQEEAFFMLQAFLITCTLTSLALAATMTQRREAEQALQEAHDNCEKLVDERTEDLKSSEQRMRDYSESVSDWFWETDKDHRFSYFSKETLDGIPLAPQNAIGKVRWELRGQDIHEQKWRQHRAVLDAHEPFRNFRYKVTAQTGEKVWLSVSGSPVHDSHGEFIGYRGTSSNITEYVKFEERSQQQLKMEALGTLAGGIAHDLNNTLVPIIGMTELVAENLPEEGADHSNLEYVLRAAMHAKELVAQILTFSRQDDKAFILIDLAQEISQAMVMVKASIPTTIKLNVNINEVGFVYADIAQILQVMMNLVSNAVCAMEEKGELFVRLNLIEVGKEMTLTHPNLEQGAYAHISVADTGPGINHGDIDRIFDPFYTTKGVGEGTGLGLSVVYGIVTNHNGVITVNSTPGEGATFNVYLPIASQKNALDGPGVTPNCN